MGSFYSDLFIDGEATAKMERDYESSLIKQWTSSLTVRDRDSVADEVRLYIQTCTDSKGKRKGLRLIPAFLRTLESQTHGVAIPEDELAQESVPENVLVTDDAHVPEQELSPDKSIPESESIPEEDLILEEELSPNKSVSEDESIPEDDLIPEDVSIREEDLILEDESVYDEESVSEQPSIPEYELILEEPDEESVQEEELILEDVSVEEELRSPNTSVSEDKSIQEELSPNTSVTEDRSIQEFPEGTRTFESEIDGEILKTPDVTSENEHDPSS
jgi:hypothetical protein